MTATFYAPLLGRFLCAIGFLMYAKPVQLQIEPLTEGGYVATSSDVPGLVVQAEFLRDLRDIADEVAVQIAQSCLEHGDSLPPIFI
jgi:predicted RNase H-like HicB family nuclease